MIPEERVLDDSEHLLNTGRRTLARVVANTANRPPWRLATRTFSVRAGIQ